MDPITVGSALAITAAAGKGMHFFWVEAKKMGADRKELNGTVERVKQIETDVREMKNDISYIRGKMDQ